LDRSERFGKLIVDHILQPFGFDLCCRQARLFKRGGGLRRALKLQAGAIDQGMKWLRALHPIW
jgi:hypothetical protein